jgi:Uma2 family endonuclease
MEARLLDPLPDSISDPDAFYHHHPEDSVPESGIHDAIVLYLHSVLAVHFPESWVASDVCCYWIPGNNRIYLAPDVFVTGAPRPEPISSSYRAWEHGPLRLVIEVGSRTSLRRDVGPKLERYAEGLLPQEYLYYDADLRHLRLHRRTAGVYVEVLPDDQDRVWSDETGLYFQMSADGYLRALYPSGDPLLSHGEEVERRREAERRVAALEAELARLRQQ